MKVKLVSEQGRAEEDDFDSFTPQKKKTTTSLYLDLNSITISALILTG